MPGITPLLALFVLFVIFGTTVNANTQCKVRKDLRSLSASERRAMMDGFRAMALDGTIERLRQTHEANLQSAHNTPNFLLWHRAFGIDVENELLAHTTGLQGLPFHNLPADAMDPARSIAFTADLFGALNSGCIDPFTSEGQCLQRKSVSGDWGACASSVLATVIGTNQDYTRLSRAVEGTCHNQIHSSFPDSSIYLTTTSPSDPWFYPFHAGIDHVFAQWQNVYSDPGSVDMNAIILDKRISSLFAYSEGNNCYTYEGLASPNSPQPPARTTTVSVPPSTPTPPSQSPPATPTLPAQAPPTETTQVPPTAPTLSPPPTSPNVPQVTDLGQVSKDGKSSGPWIPEFHSIPSDWFDHSTFTQSQIDGMNRIFATSIQFLRRAQAEGKEIPSLDDFNTIIGNTNWTTKGIADMQANKQASPGTHTSSATRSSVTLLKVALTVLALAFAAMF